MCGYCMESAIFAERLAALDPDEDYQFAPDMLSLRLQEAVDWRAELMACPEGMCAPVAAVALCRWWMDRIRGIAGDAVFESELDTALAERLRADARTVTQVDGWTWLADWHGPLPEPLPVDAARAALDVYIADTLKTDRTRTEREQRPGAWVHLMCALAILQQTAPDDPRLRLLALTAPVGSIGLLGVELWLQRRAMLACVASQGITFLIEHADSLRNEIVASLAMQDTLSSFEFQLLMDAMISRSVNQMNLDMEDLWELLNAMASRKSR